MGRLGGGCDGLGLEGCSFLVILSGCGVVNLHAVSCVKVHDLHVSWDFCLILHVFVVINWGILDA